MSTCFVVFQACLGLVYVFFRCVGKRCTVYTMFIVYFKLYNTLRLLYLIASASGEGRSQDA